jgi:hypothetical protein
MLRLQFHGAKPGFEAKSHGRQKVRMLPHKWSEIRDARLNGHLLNIHFD